MLFKTRDHSKRVYDSQVVQTGIPSLNFLSYRNEVNYSSISSLFMQLFELEFPNEYCIIPKARIAHFLLVIKFHSVMSLNANTNNVLFFSQDTHNIVTT